MILDAMTAGKKAKYLLLSPMINRYAVNAGVKILKKRCQRHLPFQAVPQLDYRVKETRAVADQVRQVLDVTDLEAAAERVFPDY